LEGEAPWHVENERRDIDGSAKIARGGKIERRSKIEGSGKMERRSKIAGSGKSWGERAQRGNTDRST
ncbi:hypothetical protein POVCU2_0012140, partial [Plasmodium ovale curtisi]